MEEFFTELSGHLSFQWKRWCRGSLMPLGFLSQHLTKGLKWRPPGPTTQHLKRFISEWLLLVYVRNIPVPLYTSVPCNLPASLGLATWCITQALRVYSRKALHPSRFPIHTRSSQTHLYSPPVVSKQAAPAWRLRVASASNISTPSDCAHVIKRYWF